MKNTLKLSVAVLTLLLVPQFVHAQQYTLGQTTLSAAVTKDATQIQVASATGINGYGPNLQPIISNPVNPQSNVFIDREEIEIRSVSATLLQVRRGVNGTTASAHASGAMVLSGPAIVFYTNDPGGTPASPGYVSGGSCTKANTLVTPWLNVRSGGQWLCSTVTNTWVPGFGNGANPSSSTVTTAVASAAGQVTPSGPLFHITGGLAITGFLIPVGCNATAVGGCSFQVIPDGTFTWTSANNIAIAGTAVVNKIITFLWDATNSKWVPNVLS